MYVEIVAWVSWLHHMTMREGVGTDQYLPLPYTTGRTADEWTARERPYNTTAVLQGIFTGQYFIYFKIFQRDYSWTNPLE